MFRDIIEVSEFINRDFIVTETMQGGRGTTPGGGALRQRGGEKGTKIKPKSANVFASLRETKKHIEIGV